MYGEGVRVAEDSDEFVTKDFDVRRRQRRRKGVWAYYVRGTTNLLLRVWRQKRRRLTLNETDIALQLGKCKLVHRICGDSLVLTRRCVLTFVRVTGQRRKAADHQE